MFFKKHANGIIQNADSLRTKDGEMTEDNHSDFTYPTSAGWYYFATPQEAYEKLNRSEIEITNLQGRLAIKQLGQVQTFLTWFNSLDPVTDFATIAYFKRSPVWKRDNPILIAGIKAMGFNDNQIDHLFTVAKTL